MNTSSRSFAGWIDASPLTRFQITIFILCGCVAFLDGLDSQSIAIAAPLIVDALGLQKTQLGVVFSSGVLGGVLSALALGTLADRIGRKRVLVAATALFGFGTLGTAFAGSFMSLVLWRVLAGVGLGGAVPCFLALASEYAPARRRATISSLLWAAFPLGGMAGGFANGWILRHYDWHVIFVVGGALPLLCAVAVAAWLPESTRFLATRPGRQAALARIARRLGAPQDLCVSPDEIRAEGVPLRQLFANGRSAATLLLSGAFFTAFGTLAIALLWTPILLRQNGIHASDAAIVVGYHGLGALIGMGAVGRLIERFGSVRVLVPALLAGAVSIALTEVMGSSVLGSAITMTLVGLFVGIGASGAISLAVLVFPSEIRSTGVGWSMGAGRLGQVVAPVLIGVLIQHGVTVEQVLLYTGVAPAVAALCIAVMGIARLLPPREARTARSELAVH